MKLLFVFFVCTILSTLSVNSLPNNEWHCNQNYCSNQMMNCLVDNQNNVIDFLICMEDLMEQCPSCFPQIIHT